ncbi:MAG: methyltransferase domain-containing protein [Phormidesmis sp.]
MGVQQLLKQSDGIVGIVRDSRDISRALGRVTKLSRRSKNIDSYLAAHPIKKLQLGAGPTALKGWLSTDIDARPEHVEYLDVTKPFPFADDTFDYVYSEHVIEHVSWQNGAFMLSESKRILKPGGKIRIATPDLSVLLNLYQNRQDPAAQRYISWITDRYLPGVDIESPIFVINNAFRNWGHQFLYDGELMALAMKKAGYANIKRYAMGESDDEQLCEVEAHGKNLGIQEMAAFETMVYEAECPMAIYPPAAADRGRQNS